MSEVTTPKPGFYPSIPFDEYRAWSALNNSTMKAAYGRAAIHAYAAMTRSSEPSAAMEMGTAIHCAVLEPSRYEADRRILPEINKKSSVERGERAYLIESEPSAIWIEKDDADAIEIMRSNIRQYGLARKISGSKGERELSIRWDDDGVPCRARLDKLCPSVAIVDLKSTRDAAPESFERDAVKLGYHRQGAWYVDGWKAITGEVLPYIILAIETSYPFAVNCFVLDADLIECGRRENAETFAMVAPCWKSGVWTGYPEKLNTLMAPTWLSRRCGLGG
jgi:hypothetical protein